MVQNYGSGSAIPLLSKNPGEGSSVSVELWCSGAMLLHTKTWLDLPARSNAQLMQSVWEDFTPKIKDLS